MLVNPADLSNKYKKFLFDLKNQLFIANNTRLFYDLITSNSIEPYSVNSTSDLLLLANYFSQILDTNDTFTASSKIIDGEETNAILIPPPNLPMCREFYAITLKELKDFSEKEQGEKLDDAQLKAIIDKHESNYFYRSRHMLSFNGFAKYLLDKDNYMHENDYELINQKSNTYLSSEVVNSNSNSSHVNTNNMLLDVKREKQKSNVYFINYKKMNVLTFYKTFFSIFKMKT